MNSDAFRLVKKVASLLKQSVTCHSAAPLLSERRLMARPASWAVASMGSRLRPSTQRMFRPGQLVAKGLT